MKINSFDFAVGMWSLILFKKPEGSPSVKVSYVPINQRAVMCNLLDLVKISAFVIQNAAQPIVRRVRRASNPAHKVKRQNFIPLTIANQFFYKDLLAVADSAHHVR